MRNGRLCPPTPEMEASARLAAGLAHDLNNILSAILGFNELCLKKVDPGDPSHRFMTEIRNAADRAAGLARQLQAFGERQILKPRPLDLPRLVEDMKPRLRGVLGESIRLVVRSSEGIGRVDVDPIRMQEVVTYLAANARAAMPRGGTLTIEIDEVDGINGDPDPHVRLAIRDTGGGLDEESLRHIFEPFYSTKTLGRGTGLGLAAVYGMVAQSGGVMGVQNEAKVGTAYQVYLPSVAAPVSARS